MIRALLLIPILFSCAGPTLPTASLDYTEIESPTGWRLRVYGDGGGSISHQQLPTYHLHYPAKTFPALHPRQRPNSCSAADEFACNKATFYSSLHDSSFVCACAGAGWTNEIMVVAIERMDEAVDAGGSERSCRMLRRRWLVQ